MGSLLCRLGLHRWVNYWKEVPHPEIEDAVRFARKCRRCGRGQVLILKSDTWKETT